MKFPDAPRASGALLFTLGAVVGAGGVLLALVSVVNGHRQEWLTLFELPVGEFYALADPPAVIQKTGPRVLAFRPLPSRKDVRVVQLFGTMPELSGSMTPGTTTSTRPPVRKKPAEAKPPEPKKKDEKTP